MKKRMQIMKQVAKAMPFVCLLANCITVFLYHLDWYDQTAYYVLSQITGHSLLLLVGYAFFAHYHRLCYYTLISIYGLIALNLFNSYYYAFGGINHYLTYVSVILLVTLCLSIIYIIKRK